MKKTLLLLTAALMIGGSSCAKKQNNNAPMANVNTEVKATADEAVPYTVKTIDAKLSGDKILPAILANYRGKVVLIDYWATWCGPCRMAMKQIKDIKDDLAKKGCVFVYVTGETSPEADWKKMISGISGDHYRLSNKQWGELCQLLNIPGIPSYQIIGKDGKSAYDNFKEGGYPGSEVLKNNIEVALTAK